MTAAAGERGLPQTPTWAVALVFAVMVLVAVAFEHGLRKLGHWFQRRQKKALAEALEKIRTELMTLAFISLLLAVGQTSISNICIPEKVGSIMLPCKVDKGTYGGKDNRRLLVGVAARNMCQSGQVALMLPGSMHQLHIFIFVLALFHVVYSVSTMALGRLKMKQWKKWESETSSLQCPLANDPSRFRLTHETPFVRRHLGLSSTPGVRWIVAFFRQFFGSVTKVDYLTMRQGFINAHLSQNSKFNFHKYIKRSLQDDFKVIVGISPPGWFVAVLTLFLDIEGVDTLIWISFVPFFILLLIGTKLQTVIVDMARDIQNRAIVIKGAPVVEPNNKFFWFNRPGWVLFLIQLTLFENAFQMAHFVWTLATPGLKECYHKNMGLSIMKAVAGIAFQILCGYITFPLYALVTQMGSHMKLREVDEFMMPSRGTSPVDLLQGRSDDPQSAPALPRFEEEATDLYPRVQLLHRLDPAQPPRMGLLFRCRSI